MDERTELLSIGAFAELIRLSIKALRLYDQLNILAPCYVDPQSGYRFYESNQLPGARLIRSMREMDMPLAVIRRVLAVMPISQAQVELLVRQHLELRERQLEQIKQLARKFTAQLGTEASPMSLEVNVRDIPTLRIISILRHHKVNGLSKQIDRDIGELFSSAYEYGARPAGPAFGVYHGPINEQEDGPVEICLAVDGKVESCSNIEVKQLEGGKAACVIIQGEQCRYPDLLSAYDTAVDWIQRNGFETAGPPREVWHTGPGPDAKWEIVWLFK